MQPIYFFSIYGMLLIASSILICGWFTITRGQIIENEDGSKEKVGQLLKGWYFFWHREKEEKKRIYYRHDNLHELFNNLKALGEKDIVLNGLYSFDAPDTFINKIADYQRKFGIKFETKSEFQVVPEDKTKIKLIVHPYREEENYVFPEWLRKMTSGCITCHASIYGSVCYWSFIFLSNKSTINNWLYSWSGNSYMAIWVWISFIISLSFVLTVLWKKLN